MAAVAYVEDVVLVDRCLTGEEAAADSWFWGNLAATLCDLHPGDSLAVIDQAYADNLVPPGFLDPGYRRFIQRRLREMPRKHGTR